MNSDPHQELQDFFTQYDAIHQEATNAVEKLSARYANRLNLADWTEAATTNAAETRLLAYQVLFGILTVDVGNIIIAFHKDEWSRKWSHELRVRFRARDEALRNLKK